MKALFKHSQFLFIVGFSLSCIFVKAAPIDSIANATFNNPSVIKEYSDEEIETFALRPIKLSNGSVIKPKHDGVHYFVNLDKEYINKEPSKLKIEEVINKANSAGKVLELDNILQVISGSANLNFNSLPIVIKIKDDEKLKLSIVVLSLTFRRQETLAQIAIVSETPIKNADGDEEILYFGGEIAIAKGGGLKGGMKLIAPREIELFDLNGIGQLNLATSTGFCLGCSGSNKTFDLYFAGSFDFHPNIAKAEKINGELYTGDESVPSLFFGISVEDWNNMKIELTLPLQYGIQFTKFNKLGFHNYQAPPNNNFKPAKPTDGSGFCDIELTNLIGSNIQLNLSGENKGISFSNFKVRLPEGIAEPNKEIAPTFLILNRFAIDSEGVDVIANINDNQGLLGKPLKLGKGYDIKLTNIDLNILNNDLKSFLLGGELRLPTDEKNNYNAVTFGIGLATSNQGENSFDVLQFGAGYKQGGVSKFTLLGKSPVEISNYEISAGSTIRNWDFSNLLVTIKGKIAFVDDKVKTNLELEAILSNKSPFIKELILKKNNTATDGASLGGFSFSIDQLAYTAPTENSEEFQLTTGVQLQLGKHAKGTPNENKAPSIQAGGTF
jgi:hypothetical protein